MMLPAEVYTTSFHEDFSNDAANQNFAVDPTLYLMPGEVSHEANLLHDESYYEQMALMLEAQTTAFYASASMLPPGLAPPPGLDAPPGLDPKGYQHAKPKRQGKTMGQRDFKPLTGTASDCASTRLEDGTASELSFSSSTRSDESTAVPAMPAAFVEARRDKPALEENAQPVRQICYFQNRYLNRQEGDDFAPCSKGDQCLHCHNQHPRIKRRNDKSSRCTCPLELHT